MTQLLHAATAALATPMTAQGTLDEPALRRLVDRVVTGGVSGISPTGSTGEGARLSRAQRLEVTRVVRDQAPEGMPVISGIPLANVAEGIEEIQAQAAGGATAVLVAPPHYYPITDADAVNLYTRVADESPVPLVIYNIPVFTKVRFSPAVVAELAKHPRIAGIKDSSRDIEYFQQVTDLTADADFSVVTGSDTFLVACLLAGATGTIAASANLVPYHSATICRLVGEGDIEGAMKVQDELCRVIHVCRGGTPPAAWKAALAQVGVCEAYPAPPASPFDDDARRQLADDLRAAGFDPERTA